MNFIVGVDESECCVKATEWSPFNGAAVGNSLCLSFTVFDIVLIDSWMSISNQVGLTGFSKESVDFYKGLVCVVRKQETGIANTKDWQRRHVNVSSK